MKIKFREEEKATIPTASTADIAFLLIIFFMVTTTFRQDTGLKIILPEAEAAKKIPTKNLSRIWISEEGIVSIDDVLVPIPKISQIMSKKKQINPDIIISVQCDKSTRYTDVEKVFNQLVEAGLLKISLATERKRG
uniref:Biopolymer transporter ExbD n=1 Tax=candidate division WOR-3 bacterium TaxID=2052148 RepID=A0A7C4U8K3_UNCW3